jgi:hypothetical protein
VPLASIAAVMSRAVRKEALADDPAVAVDVALPAGQLPARYQAGQCGGRSRAARLIGLGGVETPDADAFVSRADPEGVAVDNPGDAAGEGVGAL